jgi:hypothetical protein
MIKYPDGEFSVPVEIPAGPATETPSTPKSDHAAPVHSASGLYLDDGDVTLRSTDGRQFKVHAHMLKMAFTHFKSNFAWHKVRDTPIAMDQDGATLEVLIKLLYPNDTKPRIPSTDLLISVLKASQDLGMSSVLVRNELAARIEADPNPLRAWAVASAFEFPETRRNAAARYIKADSYLLNYAPSELRFVDGRKVFDLVSARERALRLARIAMSQTSLECYNCDGYVSATPTRDIDNPHLSLYLNVTPDFAVRPEWRREFLSRTAAMNPFAPDATSETCFELCVEKSPCGSCKTSFANAESREARNRLRENLQNILSSVLEEIAPVRVMPVCFLGFWLIFCIA